MPNKKRTIDESQVKELLRGLVHSGTFYYKKDPVTGRYCKFPAKIKLMELNMSQVPAGRILREGLKTGLIVEEEIDLAQESHHRAVEKEANVVANATDDDIEDEEQDESGSRATSKLPLGLSDIPRGEVDRYELVKTSSGFFGYFDRTQDREVILSRDKDEVLEEIYFLRRNANKLPFAWPTGQSLS